MDPPGDPGGTAPDIGLQITIDNTFSNDTSMDTDCSIQGLVDNGKSRRKRTSKVCRHCNKKRSKGRHNEDKIKVGENDCQCLTETDPNAKNIAAVPTWQRPNLRSTRHIKEKEHNNINDNCSPLVNDNSVEYSNDVGKGTNSNSKSSPPSVARPTYQPSDACPYVVHVQRKQLNPDDSVSIHPVSFGRFLKLHKFKNIINGSLKKIGRNRLTLSFSDHKDANDFLSNSALESANYKAFIPSFSVMRMGIVRGVPTDWSEEEIKEQVSVPIGCGKILKVRRLKRKLTVDGNTELKSTESVVLTFDGQILPKRVFLCYTSLQVELYIYPTVQCYKCCRFGHVKTQCRSTPRCFRCGEGHLGENCSVSEDDTCCILCKGLHSATSKKCLEYARQKAIKETMAKSCISYSEASKQHAPISKISYADALLSSPNVSHMNTTVNSVFEPVTSPKFSDNSVTSTSYRKTVFLKNNRPPKTSNGYDVAAHKALAKDYDMPAPSKGSVINSNKISDLSNMSISDLIVALLQSLSQLNQVNSNILPSNAACLSNMISQDHTNVNNGQFAKSPTMELP